LLTQDTAELGSVFYSVREKNFDDRGVRRQTDREFSKRAELETEMAKQREAYVDRLALMGGTHGSKMVCRSARKAEEDALAGKPGTSAARIAIPGTPRHVGVGSGSRVTATPRRKPGI
jgi:pre-mRNA-splicing factor ATP-dependent RNA helicase DHX38/PRP16